MFRSFPDDAAEAAAIAERIRELARGGAPAAEIAVLYRTNSQSEPFENALANAGLPYQVRGGERFFSRPEVRQAVLMLRAQAKVDSPEPAIDLVRAVLSGLGWTQEPPGERGAVRERWESLEALASLAGELVAAGAASLPELVAAIEELAESGHTPAARGVTLASLHAAKGLEWEAVFLAGLADGLMPISLAKSPDEVAEERRLLYVGITRAKRHLQLSFAQARVQGGNATRRSSPFLEGIWPTAETVAKRARGLAVPEKSELTARESALFEDLKEWRLEHARAAGLPAFTVVTDLTLRALASRRPSSTRELAAVPGLGPVKIERYGAELLALVAAAK
jgi:DNA helicase-2/ATP-dependent DNA helicase PcrA